MPQHATEFELVAVDQISPHPKNPNKGDVESIRESIIHNGFRGVLTVHKDTGHILWGNHRYLAAVDVGLDKVPVEYVDCSEEEAYRIMIAGRQTERRSEWDMDNLTFMLAELRESDMLDGTAFNADELNDLLSEAENMEVDFEIAVAEEKPKVEPPKPIDDLIDAAPDPLGEPKADAEEDDAIAGAGAASVEDVIYEATMPSTKTLALTFEISDWEEVNAKLTSLVCDEHPTKAEVFLHIVRTFKED